MNVEQPDIVNRLALEHLSEPDGDALTSRATSVKSSVTHVGDIDMYYEVHGSGDPIVLAGGLANDLSEWEWLVNWCARPAGSSLSTTVARGEPTSPMRPTRYR